MVLDLYPQKSAFLALQVVDEGGKGVPNVQLLLAGNPASPTSALDHVATEGTHIDDLPELS